MGLKSEGQLSSHLISWWQRKALAKVGPSGFPIPTPFPIPQTSNPSFTEGMLMIPLYYSEILPMLLNFLIT